MQAPSSIASGYPPLIHVQPPSVLLHTLSWTCLPSRRYAIPDVSNYEDRLEAYGSLEGVAVDRRSERAIRHAASDCLIGTPSRAGVSVRAVNTRVDVNTRLLPLKAFRFHKANSSCIVNGMSIRAEAWKRRGGKAGICLNGQCVEDLNTVRLTTLERRTSRKPESRPQMIFVHSRHFLL